MAHPLSDQQRADIKESWGKVQQYGLQKAGIAMFKRLCILFTCLPYKCTRYTHVCLCVCTCVSVGAENIVLPCRKAVAIAVNLSTQELTLAYFSQCVRRPCCACY